MMNIADMLNPSATTELLSPPTSPIQVHSPTLSLSSSSQLDSAHGKPRCRFSELEDTVICEGVAKKLTWGQISSQLPHRKRATCFNRYRTLQGIRKSRKRSESKPSLTLSITPSSSPKCLFSPTTPATPAASPSSHWTPTTPPSDMFLSTYPVYSSNDDPLIRRLSCPKNDYRVTTTTLPPIFYSHSQRRSNPTQFPYLV